MFGTKRSTLLVLKDRTVGTKISDERSSELLEQDFATYAQKQERVNVTCVDLAALLDEHRVLRIDWLQVLRPQATLVA